MNKSLIGQVWYTISLLIIFFCWVLIFDISDEILLVSIILFWIYHQIVVIRLELEK